MSNWLRCQFGSLGGASPRSVMMEMFWWPDAVWQDPWVCFLQCVLFLLWSRFRRCYSGDEGPGVYLKTARVKDHSTKGFLSSNFSLCFIRWRPPSIQAAYSAENRNDFFLQGEDHRTSVTLSEELQDSAPRIQQTNKQGFSLFLNADLCWCLFLQRTQIFSTVSFCVNITEPEI